MTEPKQEVLVWNVEQLPEAKIWVPEHNGEVASVYQLELSWILLQTHILRGCYDPVQLSQLLDLALGRSEEGDLKSFSPEVDDMLFILPLRKHRRQAAARFLDLAQRLEDSGLAEICKEPGELKIQATDKLFDMAKPPQECG